MSEIDAYPDPNERPEDYEPDPMTYLLADLQVSEDGEGEDEDRQPDPAPADLGGDR
jgi:hypothetical protein